MREKTTQYIFCGENKESVSSMSKNSPFCSGINKSLLTPCRQVGLSRKRKTSINPVKSSENVNTSSNNIYIPNETTPVTHDGNVSKRKRNKNLFLNFQTSINQAPSTDDGLKTIVTENENCDIKLSKKDLLQTFTSEDIFDTNDDQPRSGNFDMKDNADQIYEAKFVKKEKLNENVADSKKMDKLKRRKLSSDFINFETICIKNEKSFGQNSVSYNSDDDFEICKSSKNKQANIETESNPVKNILSLSKSSVCAADDSFETKNTGFMKKCKIQIQKLSEGEMKSNILDNTFIKVLSKKCNSNSMDDADFFTSTPEEEMTKRKNLEKNMVMLENQIKQKRSILENLERASIYKSKHNIPELKQLTSIWLDGCVLSLKDLLIHLQAHGPIDVITVLNNMQIPKEIVAKLPL